MRIFRRLAICLPLLLLTASPARADAIAVGDSLTFEKGPGHSGGGAFFATVNGDPTSVFATFCLQSETYLDFTSTFYVQGISQYAYWEDDNRGGDTVTGRDYLSDQTAWLYTQLRNGTLTGYDNSAEAMDGFQWAVWVLEEEEWQVPEGAWAPLANYFISLSNQAVAGGWRNPGNVVVLNLVMADGTDAQDQIAIVPTPEPSSLALLGAGGLVLWMNRRRLTTGSLRARQALA